jgi:hypothetical protein
LPATHIAPTDDKRRMNSVTTISTTDGISIGILIAIIDGVRRGMYVRT